MSEEDLLVLIRENCADDRGCRTSTCTDRCRIDQAAERWVLGRHTEDFCIGDASQTEWDAAYEHAVRTVEEMTADNPMDPRKPTLAELADAPFEVKRRLGTVRWIELWDYVARNPQAHIDALVEAGVLSDALTGFGHLHAYQVVQPHVHEWRVMSVNTYECMAFLQCPCGESKSVSSRLPIEVPDA